MLDGVFWWTGAATISALCLLGLAVVYYIARAGWFAAIFAKRAISALGWREGVPWWKKPIGFARLTWKWTWAPPDSIRGQDGSVVHHPRLKRSDYNEDD